jgi:hypothetical protein
MAKKIVNIEERLASKKHSEGFCLNIWKAYVKKTDESCKYETRQSLSTA